MAEEMDSRNGEDGGSSQFAGSSLGRRRATRERARAPFFWLSRFRCINSEMCAMRVKGAEHFLSRVVGSRVRIGSQKNKHF